MISEQAVVVKPVFDVTYIAVPIRAQGNQSGEMMELTNWNT
jgi:hypothetical protein